MKPILCLIFFVSCYAGICQQKKHVQRFSYVANTQTEGLKQRFTFYYIVDSNVTYKKGGLCFYGFTFSKDSLELSGFISHDKASHDILYIADTSSKKTSIQRIFSFTSKGTRHIQHFPFLGYGIAMIKKEYSRSITFTPQYSFSSDSHAVFIKNIEFEKGKIFPYSITFYFPFEEENRVIKVYSNTERLQ